jgi:translation elongation factor EF-Tu-like GTPase
MTAGVCGGMTTLLLSAKAQGAGKDSIVHASRSSPRELRILPPRSPQFFVRTTDVPGRMRLLGEIEMCVPGDHARLAINLGRSVACEVGDRFAIREGDRTIGSGVVTRVVA